MGSTSLPAPAFQSLGAHFAIDLPGARALFTSRRGGHSKGPYESLNLGPFTDDEPDAVSANFELIEDELGVTTVWGRQVHGACVKLAGPGAGGDQRDEADGRVTAADGVAPLVMTADCMAIALAGGGTVAMLHAGWRGLAGGVIEQGVRRLRELAGARATLSAAIGPHARACCYEVGAEVRVALGTSGSHLDMSRLARHQLRQAGVTGVEDIELCTICSDPALFFSHRRDRGLTGRQAGLVWVT